MVLVWEPIKDLPEDWSLLTDGELGPLLQFWNDQRVDLEQSGALAEFSTRLPVNGPSKPDRSRESATLMVESRKP